MAPSENVNEKVKKGFFAKKKGLKIAGIVVLAILMLGGVVGALVVQSIKNQPQNVAAKSISNYLFGIKEGGKSKITFKFSGNGVESGEAVLSLATSKGLSSGQANVDFKVDGNQLGGSVQVAENGSFYIKVNNISSILSAFTASSSTLSNEQKEMLNSLGEKWVEVTPDDIKSLGGDKFSTENECSKALSETLMGDDLGNLVDSTYTANRFMTAKNSSTEELDGRKVLKVEVGLDEATAKKFGQKLSQNSLVKGVLDKCKDEFSGLSNNQDSSSTEFKNGKLTVWADRSKKQLVKLEASGEMVKDGESEGMLSLVVEPNKGDVSIEEIGEDDKVNIKELLSAFGVSPEMIQSLVSQGESEL